MQDRKNIKRTPRRKNGRTPTADLLKYSSDAYAIGSAAKRLYASVRLSLDGRTAKRLIRTSRFFGVTLSKAARLALVFAEAKTHAERKAAMRLYETRTRNGTRPSKPKRGTYTAADLWAREASDHKGRTLVNIRLTAWNLANIETERSELEQAAGHIGGKSYSAAFRSLVHVGLMVADALIDAYDRGRFIGIDPKNRAKPTRHHRNRLMTEAKRRLIESGTKSDL